MPRPTPPPVDLSPPEQQGLDALVRRHTAPQQVVVRARIVLLAAEGVPLDRVARQLAVDRNVVRTWVDRYRGGGLAALRDRLRPGRPRAFSPGGGAAPGATGLRAARASGALAQSVGLR